MPVFTCHTLSAGGKQIIIPQPSVGEYKDDALTKWEFTHRPITAGDELAASSIVIDLRLIGPTGAKEPRAIWLAKGRTYATRLVSEWNVPGPAGSVLPVNPENIDAVLPSSVLAEFGAYCELGVADDEAIAAAKKPQSGDTKTT